MIDPRDYALLRPHLAPGERALWTGRPKQGLAFASVDLVLVPFGIVWTLASANWNIGVWDSGAPVLANLIGLPFVALGLYMTFGRFLHDAWLRRRTLYAVTSERVIALRLGRAPRLRALALDRLPMLDLHEGRGGRGSILFEEGPDRSRLAEIAGSLEPSPTAAGAMLFHGIERARIVHDLVRRESDRRTRERIAGVPEDRRFIG